MRNQGISASPFLLLGDFSGALAPTDQALSVSTLSSGDSRTSAPITPSLSVSPRSGSGFLLLLNLYYLQLHDCVTNSLYRIPSGVNC